MTAGLTKDQDSFYDGFVTDFFSANGELVVTEEQRQEALALCAQADKRAALACLAAFGTTDYRDDLPKVSVPHAGAARRQRRDGSVRGFGPAHPRGHRRPRVGVRRPSVLAGGGRPPTGGDRDRSACLDGEQGDEAAGEHRAEGDHPHEDTAHDHADQEPDDADQPDGESDGQPAFVDDVGTACSGGLVEARILGPQRLFDLRQRPLLVLGKRHLRFPSMSRGCCC